MGRNDQPRLPALPGGSLGSQRAEARSSHLSNPHTLAQVLVHSACLINVSECINAESQIVSSRESERKTDGESREAAGIGERDGNSQKYGGSKAGSSGRKEEIIIYICTALSSFKRVTSVRRQISQGTGYC